MNKIFLKLKMLFFVVMTRISIALYNVEESVLKADPFSLFGDKATVMRQRYRNRVLDKMVMGEKDEQFVKDFYEILKKADKFIQNTTPEKAEMVANKHSMSIGRHKNQYDKFGRLKSKDKWGRRYDHFGFFDRKSKHYGKTLAQVMKDEISIRTTDDEQYEVEIMFSNIPKTLGMVENNEIDFDKKIALNEYEKTKIRKFPLKINREQDVLNKIEQLAEYVHVRRITDEEKLLEFFIPRKFKVHTLSEDDPIFKEIVDFKTAWISDEYKNMYGYTITKYVKRVEFIDNSIKKDEKVIYDVLKLRAKLIKKIN